MSRYIGVDILETEIKSIICYAPNEETILLWDALKKGVLERIKYITPADVVEVVRCKDCKHYVAEVKYCDKWGDMFNHWEECEYVDPNGYCHMGERKE